MIMKLSSYGPCSRKSGCLNAAKLLRSSIYVSDDVHKIKYRFFFKTAIILASSAYMKKGANWKKGKKITTLCS